MEPPKSSMVDAATAGAATGAAATVAATPAPAPTMKLFIDTEAKRVLLAEAGKDAVDLLFSILATPIGILARLLREDGAQAPGAFNIYASAEKMDPSYMKSSGVQDALLNSHRYSLLQHPILRAPPSPAATTVPAPSTLVRDPTPSMPQSSSSYTTNYDAEPTTETVPSCGAAGGGITGGFVQDLVTYTVMDDLTIAPKSNITDMLNGEEKGLVLEEKLVQIGVRELRGILKASLRSNTVLTDVFLSKDATEVPSPNKRARHDKIPDYYV